MFTTLSFLFIASGDRVQAQCESANEESGYFICYSPPGCETVQNPGCKPGYREPDNCIGEPSSCCTVDCDCAFINCVPADIPPEFPETCAEQNEDWSDYLCVTADGDECEDQLGVSTPCLDNDVVRNCCRPPEQEMSPCVLMGALCRTPAEQDTPGECNWNEIYYGEGTICSNYPEGTLCCDPVLVVDCPSEGECKDSCDSSSESEYSGINECNNPALVPPDGGVCCLPKFGPPPEGPEIFCVAGQNDPEQRTNDPISGRIATAIGCVPVRSQQLFVDFILRWAAGIAGGVAFVFIIYSGFIIITSGGNPQKLQAGKELLTAAISGLLLLIFGVFVLEFIGVDIFNIPGFGK